MTNNYLADEKNRFANELRLKSKFKDAIDLHQEAIALAPSEPKFWYDLSETYLNWNKPEAAELGFRHALKIIPSSAQLLTGLGSALQRQKKLREAIQCYAEATSSDPTYVPAWINLGTVQKQLGDCEDAVFSHQNAVQLDPTNKIANWNLSLTLLLLGNYKEGWSLYEFRHERSSDLERLREERHGSYKRTQKLLVKAEQGLGDVLQFVRFLPELKKLTDHLTLAVDSRLKKLLTSGLSFADEIIDIEQEEQEEFCATIYLMSAPFLLNFQREQQLSSKPYLVADRHLEQSWRTHLQNLDSKKCLRVGIAWQGNPRYEADYQRSIPLTYFVPLLELPNIHFVSLQKQHGLEQLANIKKNFRLDNLGEALDSQGHAFVDTAAVLTNLDLLITSDTAIAHLAGAMGVETWLALSKVPDWRWGLEGAETFWYENMRLFRQREFGDWSSVFVDIKNNLIARCSDQ